MNSERPKTSFFGGRRFFSASKNNKKKFLVAQRAETIIGGRDDRETGNDQKKKRVFSLGYVVEEWVLGDVVMKDYNHHVKTCKTATTNFFLLK